LPKRRIYQALHISDPTLTAGLKGKERDEEEEEEIKTNSDGGEGDKKIYKVRKI
jgi:hypothetical protein